MQLLELTLRRAPVGHVADVPRVSERVTLGQRDDGRLRAHPGDDAQSNELRREAECEGDAGATTAGVEVGALGRGRLLALYLHVD